MDHSRSDRQKNVSELSPLTHATNADTKLAAESEYRDLYCSTLHEDEASKLSTTTLTLREWLDLAEAWRIRQVLNECRGNRSATARRLGIGRRTLYSKMERLQIATRITKKNDTKSASPAA